MTKAKPEKPAKFKAKASMSEAYYRAGMYLNKITRAGTNVRGEPVISFNVLKSHDGAHVNSYYTVNFFMGEESSEKSQKMWTRKFGELMQALGIKPEKGEYEIDMGDLIGREVVLAYTASGFSPLPNFYDKAKFDPAWKPKPRTIARPAAMVAPYGTDTSHPAFQEIPDDPNQPF